MPLFILRAKPAEACAMVYLGEDFEEEPSLDEIHVIARTETRARQLAVRYLMEEERFSEIQTFASPVLSTIEQVNTRAPETIFATYNHHCEDHS